MLSEQKIRDLLKGQNLTDKEILEIRDGFHILAEIIFEKWQQEKRNKTTNE